MRKKSLLLVVVLIMFWTIIPKTAYGQSTASTSEEMRGVWMSTVYNIDWPSEDSYNNADSQKASLAENMQFIKDLNMNTVFFQVRGMGDSLYPSSYAPWSKYLTGNLGENPGYDPLKLALEDAHSKGLEFQAWFNPFRVYVDSGSNCFNKDQYINALPQSSPLKQNPQWIVKYGKYHWIDIGEPEARDYVISTILEVVRNYDIDGVHIDDYFYPYPISDIDFPDDSTYEKYGSGYGSKADWRRDNVNKFVRDLNKKIKEIKASVKFGVSPFGIWRNGTEVGGSETNGLSSYDAIYTDSKKWIEEQWIDYIIPQIYWEFGHKAADYKTLVDWWAKQVQGKNVHLYIGHGAYKLGDSSYGEAWSNPEEIPNQIKYARENENVKGSSFFSLKTLKRNPLNLQSNLKTLYNSKVSVPEMGWFSKWVLKDGHWYYTNGDGSFKKDWVKVNDHWYYLGEDGIMRTGVVQVRGYWYYLNPHGEMETGWQKINGTWNYFHAGGDRATGWINLRGYWYYLEQNGAMATGWKEYGPWKYYLHPGGDMATGWQNIEGKWYYFHTGGDMAKGWINLRGYWYYLEADGAMATGWKVYGQWKYYLHPGGDMATGWKNIEGKWYYFYPGGDMAVSKVIDGYRVDSNGVRIN